MSLPLVAVIGHVLEQSLDIRVKRLEAAEPFDQPILQAIVDFAGAAGVTFGRRIVATLGQSDGFLEQVAQGFDGVELTR